MVVVDGPMILAVVTVEVVVMEGVVAPPVMMVPLVMGLVGDQSLQLCIRQPFRWNVREGYNIDHLQRSHPDWLDGH